MQITQPALLVDQLTRELQYDPHAVLGLHTVDGKRIVRIWRPGAPFLWLEVFGTIVEARRVHDAGLFECEVPENTTHFDYRVYHQNGLLSYDPYAFLPSFGTVDQYLFGSGTHYSLHRKMGGRLTIHQGVYGAKFTVWAPSAKSVSLVADFNHFDGRVNPMRSLGGSGVWELFVPGLVAGEKYKFEVTSNVGEMRLKIDPYALSSEMRPNNASVLADIASYDWHDGDWMHRRACQNLNRPVNIYELHLGSWQKRDGYFMGYRELADKLVEYVLDLGYTHIELMPMSEHPLDESWGYQVTGFHAVTSRFGSPVDFQYFVDTMHQHGIGVIVDWVPGHFPRDSFSLARFDGTCLYEHEDPRQGIHPHWDTCIFNFGRKEVTSFLLSSALVWLDLYHIDGLRVDAVASMLYLDYGRNEGEWIPNCFGGKENLEAIEFLKHANSIVHDNYPGVLTIAEESTAFPRVSHPLLDGGLGFDLKWNMGWMNDTLRYFSKDPLFRSWHHNDLTFGLLYAFTEHFTLVLSHDEVVHGKQSLLSKMPGDMWQKFANLRLLLGYMTTMPGKKLLFMGGEIGQWNEWNCQGQLDWNLLQYPLHNGLRNMVKELNHLYRANASLWENDFSYTGFEWVDFRDEKNSVIAFRRKAQPGSPADEFLCVLNFTPQYHPDYVINQGNLESVEELFCSDEERFGGSGKAGLGTDILYDQSGEAYGVRIKLAPLACQIYRIHFR
jgi:1,4-alpha-glucan branching enzyme